MENTKKRKRTGAERDRRKAELAEAKRSGDSSTSQPNPTPEVPSTKRPLPPADESPESERIVERIPAAIKHLRGIFKQAKTFETGRLVKKIKGMRNKTDKAQDVNDLEKQLALLSHIRVTPLISHHLQSKISRLPQHRHSALPASIIAALTPDPPTISTSTAETSASPELRTKVENRLLSAKGVGAAVSKVVVWLILEDDTKLSHLSTTGKDSKKRKREDSSASLDIASPVMPSKGGLKEISGEVLSDVDEDLELDDLDSEVMDDDGDAAGWESGSISGGSIGDGDEEQESEEESDDDKPPNRKVNAEKPSKAAKKASAKDPSSSLFLPSLASGFTRGNDSDSDPDLDMDDTGTIGKAKRGADRKNRRGQRARQAIWEKKFGKHAKHVQQQRKEDAEAAEKKAERAEKRAAKYEARGQPPPRGPSGRGYGRPAGAMASVSVPPPAGPTASGGAGAGGAIKAGKNVHPSWEAARARKKQENAAANAPKATKIVFD